ncbi:hypothetical protein KM472_gp064 [Cynomolgus macaque cytomegalovirus strain Ottawa]|uniref:Uncharacterized protein n=1 Tax=macacine betaherpesvirus 8 TaxID=2560567 RepID=G8H167_9BETA|nr:hypothetical protein KM472_gp064 [Cynomolgus macaque cytomegalovirus strain Ottawa]AEQ32141.1 hypothetical protein cy62 [Cynomolgus macaque cytomegalovirus strain Ottawa]
MTQGRTIALQPTDFTKVNSQKRVRMITYAHGYTKFMLNMCITRHKLLHLSPERGLAQHGSLNESTYVHLILLHLLFLIIFCRSSHNDVSLPATSSVTRN